MNMILYMKEIDCMIETMNVKQLQQVIHECARKVPTQNRQAFIDILHMNQREQQNKIDTFFLQEYHQVKKILFDLQFGKKELYSTFNDEWDVDNDDGYDDYIFEDEDGIIQDLLKAIHMLEKCMKYQAYQEGYELAKQLIETYVHVYGECDEHRLGINELYNYHILEIHMKKLAKISLYVTYQAHSMEEKIDAFYEMYTYYVDYGVSIEELMQIGEESLIEFHSFIKKWITYLCHQQEQLAKKLLDDAIQYISDEDLLKYARKYAKIHPKLYVIYLQKLANQNQYDALIKEGNMALKMIPLNHMIRSHVANLLVNVTQNYLDSSQVEKYCFEAFQSHPSINHYVKLRFFSKERFKYDQEVYRLYQNAYQKKQLSSQDYFFYQFFHQQFDSVIDDGMNEKRLLGWSNTFMKQGLILFIMLCQKNKIYTKSMKAFVNYLLQHYHIEFNSEEPSDKLFYEMFWKWKSSLTLKDSDVHRFMTMIDFLLRQRVEAILNANYTSFYEECVVYIIAYAEACESLGICSLKDVIDQYRKKYSRKRNFIRYLKQYSIVAF